MTSNRFGSFDLLRLAAALMVLWSHQFALMKLTEPLAFGAGLSEFGVFIFFAISGYLNTISLMRGQSSWRFLLRRARRIFPALIGFAIFCALLGRAVTTADTAAFWVDVPDFIFRNSTTLFGLRYSLPGVFETNPFPGAMNGSLWTLPYEIKFYIFLASFAVAIRFRQALFLFCLNGALLALLVWFCVTTKDLDSAYFNKFATLFLTGSILALAEKRWGQTRSVVGVACLALLTVFTPAGYLMMIALISVLVGKIELPNWLRPRIDISYGVYLYAFPVQQLDVTFGLSFWPSLALSVAISVALALLSAIFIELPALALSSKQTPSLLPKDTETDVAFK